MFKGIKLDITQEMNIIDEPKQKHVQRVACQSTNNFLLVVAKLKDRILFSIPGNNMSLGIVSTQCVRPFRCVFLAL